jgi:predicted phosphodiesterase
MKELLIIGDVHGKINQYWKLLQNKEFKMSIQVGDFGFRKEHEWFLDNIDYTKNKINFGNHDDYTFLNELHSLNNYSYLDNYNLMSVRGAFSIDHYKRKKDIDWWDNEELSYDELQNAIDLYNNKKPNIMITHDCPHEIRKILFNIHDKSITSNGLQIMLEDHQPKIWIFGHHHKSINTIINGTNFICLNELESILI